MRGLMACVAAAMLMTGAQALAQEAAAGAAKETKAASGKAMSAKAMTAVGTVKSVAADSIVVTDKAGKDWTFSVDKSTKVFAKGGSHMTAEKKANNEPVTLADTVKVGEKVNVKYTGTGDTMRATSVRVL